MYLLKYLLIGFYFRTCQKNVGGGRGTKYMFFCRSFLPRSFSRFHLILSRSLVPILFLGQTKVDILSITNLSRQIFSNLPNMNPVCMIKAPLLVYQSGCYLNIMFTERLSVITFVKHLLAELQTWQHVINLLNPHLCPLIIPGKGNHEANAMDPILQRKPLPSGKHTTTRLMLLIAGFLPRDPRKDV